jgi:hypothetical protein
MLVLLAPRPMHYVYTPASIPSSRHVSAVRDAYRSVFLVRIFVFLLLLSLPSFICSERTKNESPSQFFLTVAQVVENDHPVPLYLANAFHKSEGWVATPQLQQMEKTHIRSLRFPEK